MKTKKATSGHIAAAMTILIWGTTFISTKILLVSFKPIEILFYRFSIGLIILTIIFPRRLKGTNIKQELLFMCAGLCGVTLYFLLENIALTFTFIGFVIAIAGIFLINFNGCMILKLNPKGDLLAVLAAVVWAGYSILTKKISGYGHNTIQTTRRVFLYGLLFMIPALFIFPFEWGLERFSMPVNLFNILFLGMGASALCFVSWNTAVKLLGAVKMSIYIYMVPAITVVTSVLVLHEKITWIAVCGTVLTVAGLFVSEGTIKISKNNKMIT